MLESWVILLVALGYLSLLFAIAYIGDKRADAGRSMITPLIYTLSIAVYCTTWTFYGSVGRAASSGVDFLPIYLGPTLVFLLWWVVLRKIIRICKVERITSIADFISSRYGKSTVAGGVVTIIVVAGIPPYISLQLKAVSNSFTVLLHHPEVVLPGEFAHAPMLQDTAFLVTGVMAVFAILFGTRHIDASEHHEGMVCAVAFESVVKLIAFLAVGVFVTFVMFDGFGDLFAQAAQVPEAARLFTIEAIGSPAQWVTLMLLSMAAIICLPRQFQVTVVENVDERHLRTAVWLFPLYLLAINIFVLPIALTGILVFPNGGAHPDTFVLAIPLAEGRELLALFVFIGGLSAATAMVIVASIALSTMVCNDLVMPVLLRLPWLHLGQRGDLTHLLLAIRRGSIVLVLLIAYAYVRYIGESYTLVTIGLMSFAAVAQLAPAIIGGIFWKGGTRNGALVGLILGFVVWVYTLLLPSFAQSGWLSGDFVSEGPFGFSLLKPYALFGLEGLDDLTHSLFWSMTFNILGYLVVSVLDRPSAIERIQAAQFVEVFQRSGDGGSRLWRGTARVGDLFDLATRFLGREQADRAFASHAASRDLRFDRNAPADARLVGFAERLLAGAIGAASARVMVGSVMKGEVVGLEEVMQILDETSHVIEHSRQLEQKSRELEAITAELRAANERLQELDRLKDDFIATVSHELRTPLTSVRSFSEVLYDNPDLDAEQRARFLGIIIKESERLTRLINQILDLAKLEAGRMEWNLEDTDPLEVIQEGIAATSGLFEERRLTLTVDLPDSLPRVYVDRDRLMQVVVNLLSNAVKFCDRPDDRIAVSATAAAGEIRVTVSDTGPGVGAADHEKIFEKFQQAGNTLTDKPVGTGLGLPISRQIIERFGGRIWVESEPGRGAQFIFTLPQSALAGRQAAK